MGIIVAKAVFVAASFLAFFSVFRIASEYFKRGQEN
jgi:prolipoprotein diacylglyceryltransferase